jgi:sulfur relay protein TusB/DsrH
MVVFLVDEPYVDIAISYAAKDEDPKIVLLQDAVYSASRVGGLSEVYVVEDDVTRRGLKVPATVHMVSYNGLVQMMEEEKVVNFL